MKELLKKHGKKIILAAGAAALLAFSFWYGSGDPETQGWKINDASSVQSSEPEITAASSAPDETTTETTTLSSQSESSETSAESNVTSAAQTVQTVKTEPVTTQKPNDISEISSQSMSETTSKAVTTTVPPQTVPPQTQTQPPQTETSAPAETKRKDVSVCTISISCKTILDNIDNLDEGKRQLVPDDGVLLAPISAEFKEGESVFDVLQRVCRENAIHMESSFSPIYNSAYIEGIANLYEFDCGSLSGWMYSVNGSFPNYGCSAYTLSDGDVIEFLYTCDLGKDVGNKVN